MASEWIEAPASEYCDSVRDGTHDSPKQVESGKLLVTSRHITGNRLDLSSAYMISDKDYEEINRRSKVDQWDVLFTMIGTVGEPCLVSAVPNYAIKNIGLFKNKTEMHGKYLYYYLCSPEAQHHTKSHSRGTTQQYIPLGALRKFPVRYPEDENEMRAITHILGSLDDKIELNRRMNETLEGMAQALFKSWFTDFDPVIDNILMKNMTEYLDQNQPSSPLPPEGEEPLDAEQSLALWERLGEGAFKGIPDEFAARARLRQGYAGQAETQEGVPSIGNKFSAKRSADNFVLQNSANGTVHVRKNFPDSFQSSELGPIPTGWVIKKAEEIVDRKKVNQKFTKKNVLESGNIPVLDQGSGLLLGFHNGTPEIDASAENPMFIFGDHTCITHLSTKPFSVGPNVIPLGSKGYNPYWTYFAIKDLQSFQEYRRHWMEFKIKDVVIPSKELGAAFGGLVGDMYVSIECNNDESATLSKLRDTLLPKLISGELRNQDAEKIIKAGA